MKRKRKGLVSSGLLLAVVGTVTITGSPVDAAARARPRVRASVRTSVLAGQSQASARRTYTLAAALGRFARQAPTVVAARLRARGLASAAGLSARFTNPSLEYEQELVFPLATQEAVSLKLWVPLGGRVARRREVARSQARLAKSTVGRLSAQGGVAFARKYFALLRLHRLIKLRRQTLQEHQDLAKRMTARAQGGGLAGIIASRLELEVRRRRFAVETLRERADRLGRRLALALGDGGSILVPAGTLVPPSAPAALTTLHAKLRTSGARRQLRTLLAVRQAEERLARAQRWPDLGLSVGYLRQQPTGPDPRVAHGLIFGLSVPLPLFSSNRKAVRLAELNSRLVRWRIKVHRNRGQVLLQDAHARALRARKRHARYRSTVLGKLPRLLQGVRVAFDGGGALSSILESLAAVGKMREAGLGLAFATRTSALALHRLLGTLPRR